jgi:hypothetical protein
MSAFMVVISAGVSAVELVAEWGEGGGLVWWAAAVED